MTDITKYGRSTEDRIAYLVQNLSDEEKYKYFRLPSFIGIWQRSTGGALDLNEHTEFFCKTNMYALRQIDAVFFKKFGVHIEKIPQALEMNEDEWKNSITPLQRDI